MANDKRKVLIVDDDFAIRESFTDYFEDHSWVSQSVESGEKALLKLQDESFLGAIVDIRLEGMDGIEFISKASGIRPDMAFVICTGSLEYVIPDRLSNVCNLSKVSFQKPVEDIAEIERELLRMHNRIQLGQENE